MGAALRKLAEEALASGSEKAGFKANALRKAAGAVEAHAVKLESGKAAMKLPGIGKGSAAYIDEFVETGAMGVRDREAREAQEAAAAAAAEGGDAGAASGDASASAKPKKQGGAAAFL